MEIVRLSPDLEYNWPVYGGAADINKGALLMPGVTAETDDGVLIKAATANADAIGVLKELHDYSVSGDSAVDGTAWVTRKVSPVAPAYVVRVLYDQTDDADVASTSTTTVTITSLEDNIDTGWLYAVSGTGVGKTAFIDTSASGSCTTKTATSWDSTTDVIKIVPLFHQLVKWHTNADKIGTDPGAGSGLVCVLQNWIVIDGKWSALNPTVHDNLSLSGRSVRFYADLVVRNTGFYTID